MYQYKFINIKVSWTGKPKEDYKQIIEEYAGKGWRLVQMIPPTPHYKGDIELIFERHI
jgi:hypothetical protein